MGNCCNVKEKNKDFTIKSTCHFQTEQKKIESLPIFSDLSRKLREAFPELNSFPFKVFLNDREIFEGVNLQSYLRSARQINITVQRIYDVEFKADNPLSEVLTNVVKLCKNSEVVASGIYLSDQFILSSKHWFTGPEDMQDGVVLTFAHDDTPITVYSNYHYVLGDCLLFRCTLPPDLIGNRPPVSLAPKPPSPYENMSALLYTKTHPVLSQENVCIINEQWELSKALPEGSLGAPLFDASGKLAGLVTSLKSAANILELKDRLIALPVNNETIPMQVVLTRWKMLAQRLSPAPDISLERLESGFSQMPSIQQEPHVISMGKFRNPLQSEAPVDEGFGDEPTSEDEDIHRAIAESIGMDYNIENIFLESAFCVSLYHNKLHSYHPSHFLVSDYEIPEVSAGYSITQTKDGVFVVFENVCYFWSGKESQEISRPNQSYVNHAAVVHKNYLCVIGGKYTQTVEGMNLISFEWESFQDLPYMVEQSTAVSIYGTVYLMGGISNKRATKDILVLSDVWDVLPVKLPIPIAGFGAIGVDDSFYILGGYSDRSYNRKIWKFSMTGEYDFLGEFPVETVFFGMQFGQSNLDYIGFSRNGRIIKFDYSAEKFYLVSIGGFESSEIDQENYLHTSFFNQE